MKGSILVSSWGYSMVLTTWVRVVEAGAKTLLVEEINSRSANDEERVGLSKLGFMQNYTMPTDQARMRNGETVKQFRLYKRGSGDCEFSGKPTGMSSKLYFKVWNGKPQFEDHCD